MQIRWDGYGSAGNVYYVLNQTGQLFLWRPSGLRALSRSLHGPYHRRDDRTIHQIHLILLESSPFLWSGIQRFSCYGPIGQVDPLFHGPRILAITMRLEWPSGFMHKKWVKWWGKRSMIRTEIILCCKGSQPLRQTMPASLKPDVSAVSNVIAPPWLNPPMTIRLGSMPERISSPINCLIDSTDVNIPSSSSSVLNPKE